MKSIHALPAILPLLVALHAVPAFAASCNVSTTGVALGMYTPNQPAPADSAGSITVQCAKGLLEILPVTINYSIDIGKGSSANYSPREMTSGANLLRYNLYRDALRINIWGDSTGGTSNVSGALALPLLPASASAVHVVYGRIFASQNAVPGAYADSIVVTVVY